MIRVRSLLRRLTPALRAAILVVGISALPHSALAQPSPAAHGPVVLVVLEELPLSSLQRADGEIDEVWYPAFADLAANSTWVRGYTSMANRNLDAVPAILSGLIPSEPRLWPTHANYPNNLFTLLAPSHSMHVVETQTRLQPPVGVDASRPEQWSGGEDPQTSQVRRLHKDGKRPLDEPEVFRRFTNDIERTHAAAGPGRGSFHFIHVMFPMSPWRFTPEGDQYFPYRLYGNFGTMWSDEPWWPEEAFRRHLLQVRFTDRLVGELLASLRKSGLYDDALLVVTASLGASFRSGDSALYTNRMKHPEDGLAVPLFIKRPGQTKASRVDGTSEAMDVLPTIADLLDLELPFAIDGCSIFDERCPVRESRRVLVLDDNNFRHIQEFPADVTKGRASLDRRIRLFGTGAAHGQFYRFGPYAAHCGKTTSGLVTNESVGRVKPHRRGTAWTKGASGVRFEGIMHLEPAWNEADGNPHVALALDGVIETIVPAPLDRRKRRIVSAILPEEALSPDGNALTVFLVTEDPKSPTFSPITLE